MTEWKEYKLEEVIDIFIDYRGKTPKKSDSGIPLVTAKVVKGGKILPPNEYIPEDEYENWMSRGYPKKNDVVLTTEAPLGEVALIKDENIALAQRLITMRGNLDIVSNVFLKYYLQSSQGQYELDSRSSGTTVFGIKASVLRQIPVFLPELAEQRAIASVLSSLDDKIDLLHRQNKTLEEMAETLFRQWFVVDASEEWEVKPLNYFGNIICGKTPSKKKLENFGGNILFIKIPDMHGKVFVFDTTDTLSVIGKESQINKTLPPWSINVSCIATVGLVTMNAFEAQTNQQINSIIPDEKFRYYLYYEMKNSYDLLQSMASGGTATLNLNTGNFSRIEIKLPDEETLFKFNDFAEPIFVKIYTNQTQIRTLEKLRDSLLPKLMSGEVRVNSIEKQPYT